MKSVNNSDKSEIARRNREIFYENWGLKLEDDAIPSNARESIHKKDTEQPVTKKHE